MLGALDDHATILTEPFEAGPGDLWQLIRRESFRRVRNSERG